MRPILPYVGLMLLGLTFAALLHPTSNTFEDLLRFVGRFLVGLLLAEWLLNDRDSRAPWFWGFVLGFALLMLRTPWSELDNPNLEGPFPHRNIQAGFCILSIPLLSTPFIGRGYRIDRRKAASIVALSAMCLFILLSKSRSALLALICATALIPFVLPRTMGRTHPKSKWLVRGGATVALLVVMLSLLPRFQQFGQEVFDPYRRSRIPIWAAAVEGWNDPTVLLFGIGMEDSFDRILLDSPQGNLNYRYRKAHYPHGLIFQWLYWGGVTALLGWLALVARTAKKLFDGFLSPSRLTCGLALIAYFVLEVFESTFRDPRVGALFWLILFLFMTPSDEEKEVSND